MTPNKSSLAIAGRAEDRTAFRFFAAIFLALVAHMAFFVFKQAPPPPEMVPKESKIMAMLPLDSNPDARGQEQLREWLAILDSSYVVRPDRVRGFSLAPNTPDVENVPLRLKDDSNSGGDVKVARIPLPTLPPGDRIRHLWKFVPPPIAMAPLPPSPSKEYPAWFLGDGTPLHQLFSNVDKVSEQFAASKAKETETVLKARFFGPSIYPEVSVTSSCGDPALDAFAIKTLMVRGRTLAINDKDAAEPFIIVVKWRKH